MNVQKVFQAISLVFAAVSFVLLLLTQSVVGNFGDVFASGIEGIFGGNGYKPTWTAILAVALLIFSMFSIICSLVLKAQSKRNWELSIFFTLVAAIALILCGFSVFFEPSTFAGANDLIGDNYVLGVGWILSIILSTAAGLILLVSLFFTKQRIKTTF
ncbi:MAG: hypothetical protein IJ837_01160 [Clostridia bacterium]|nr:hypothetical protein [Clostridia bacterium]